MAISTETSSQVTLSDPKADFDSWAEGEVKAMGEGGGEDGNTDSSDNDLSTDDGVHSSGERV